MDRVTDWLMAGDVSLRWQVERDLLGVDDAVWQATRAQLPLMGDGATLLAARGADGLWDGGAFMPLGFDWASLDQVGQPWTATGWVLQDMMVLGLDPASAQARDAVAGAAAARWDHAGQPFWDGEVEECINGRLLAVGCYFGVDMGALAARLVRDRQADGGWNCDRERGSVRSAFASTINVLEGLWAYEAATGGTTASRAARGSGEDWLLARGLMHRLTTGAVADPAHLHLRHPARWQYDVLRALDHFRSVGHRDARLGPAIDWLQAKRRPDGCWAADDCLAGRSWLPHDPAGQPSRWITLRALRVLRWWEAR
jgi:hypothetical protein